MEIAILGSLEVRVDGQPVSLGGPKQRAVLALLLLDANEVVSRDRLIDGVWGERPPPTAGRSLDSYVSRLRTLLGAERIKRRAPGYSIRVEPGELDLERFEGLLARGRASLAAGDAAAARDLLRTALELWRGPALADLLYEPFAGPESARLEDRRVLALEARIDADLALGRGAEIVGELEQLVGENPFRERLIGEMMAALYQAGRPSEALAAYQSARHRFSEELGLEPSSQLRDLERRILAQDPALAPSGTPPQPPARRSRRRPLAAATIGAAVVAAAIAAGVVIDTRGSGASVSGRVVELQAASQGDPSRLSDTPAAMAADDASVWVAEPNAGAIARVDQRSRDVVQRIPLAGAGAVAVGGGAVWAASVPGDSLIRIDPGTGTRSQTIGLGGAQVAALAFGRGRVWVADVTDQELIPVDAASGTVDDTYELLVKPTALAVGTRAIWIADYDEGIVTEIDAATGTTLETVRVGNGPTAIAIGAGAVWVANSLDSTVSKIDPKREAVAATIPVGDYPVTLALQGGSVWVGNAYSANATRIDARRGTITGTKRLDGGPASMIAAGDRVWIGTRTIEQRRGGTLRLLRTAPLAIDPAVNIQLGPLQAGGFTMDNLLMANLATGAQGFELVPDLALAIPLPTDHGLTYMFHLRPGIRYSNGEPVRADDFRRAFERLFRIHAGAEEPFRGIRGSQACTRSHCDLSGGIVTDDATRTVTFHLKTPDPDFLRNLTGGGPASPVPPGTPWHAVQATPIPGTGPYRIAHASRKEIRYVRNPYFHEWSHAAQRDGSPDVIVMRFGLSPAQEIRAIEHGEADWSADGVPSELLHEVTTRYAGQVHSYAATDNEFFQLNTTLPPFDDVRVRRALNYAIDRRVVTRLFGGPAAASPACQVLPPGLSGYGPYCPYTRRPGQTPWSAPNLAAAERLVAASHTRATAITVWGSREDPLGQPGVMGYVVGVLNRLGYNAHARVIPAHAPPAIFRTMQMRATGWADSAPANFFAPWFTCDSALNHGWFCDHALERAIARTHALEASDPRAAAREWARLDRLVTDKAAWLPLVNPRQIDFLSARVRNYEHHPIFGIIADQLTIR